MTTALATRVASKRRPLSFLLAIATAALLLAPAMVQAQVNLGTASNFGVLGATPNVNNTGPTVVVGDVGVSPAASIIGFPPGSTTGTLQQGSAAAGTAQTDLGLALAATLVPACINLGAADLGTLVLTPGVYCYSTSAQLTGNLTLNFLGDPNAAFLIRTGSTLTTASNSSVLAINTGGATCLPNVNWSIGSSATLGTGSQIAGNILSQVSITLTTGASLRGRALARTGTVTLDSNPIVGGCPVAAAVAGGPIPGGPIPTPASFVSVPTLQEWALIFLGLMLAGVGGWQVRRRAIAAR
ncbi:IPTL-CTERM sorting domain-containing protein [Caenimonas terrae]|uniref:IPTL-CTERM sorting domain-containing protein n=1 Tax=Caenimonas terrae TaxID=696074 RepID=A0ABW0N8E0_9BURK